MVVIIIYALVIGSIIGSFLNVCILRIPQKESIVTGRSHCPRCMQDLKPYDMIPVISFLLLRGRCRNCKVPISIQYPIIEVLSACLFCMVYLRYGLTFDALFLCAFGCILIVLSAIDFKTMLIPDGFHIWILVLSILRLIFISTAPSLSEALIGAAIVYIPMFILTLIMGGFGGGDLKLCAVCGLFLGWQLVLLGTVLGCIFASIWGICLLMKKKVTGKTAIPFGPFLSMGFLFSVLYGKTIINWYLQLYFPA